MNKRDNKKHPKKKVTAGGFKNNYLEMVTKTLKAILREKKQIGRWDDSEKEAITQSLLFKRVEALTCFLLPLEIRNQQSKGDIYEGNQWFFNELKSLLQLIAKDGFDPNPYTYMPKGNGEFIDCTSSVLELLVLVKKHLSHTRQHKMQSTTIEGTAKKAYDCLMSKRDKKQAEKIAWAANEKTTFKKLNLSNVYFTAYAVKALALLAKERPWPFVEESIEDIAKAINAGVAWMLDRYDLAKMQLYFDEQQNIAPPFVFGLMLIACLQGNDYLAAPLVTRLNEIIDKFVENFPDQFSDSLPFMSFLTIHVDESPAFYDNRLTVGVLVVALCRIVEFKELSDKLEELIFEQIQRVGALLLAERSSNDLWDENAYLVTSTLWGIYGLLGLQLSGRDELYSVKEADLYHMIKSCLNDPRVSKAVLQSFQELLLKKRGDI